MKKEDTELLTQLDGFEPDLVFDIGANQGESIVRFKALWPDTRIESFEPRLSAYSQLVIVGKQYEGVRCNCYGLGDYNGTHVINEILDKNGFGGRSSILDHKILPAGHTTTKEVMTLFRLDDIIEDMPSFKRLFIKIDVEGYAKHVIDGASETIRRAYACLIEVNLNDKYDYDQTMTYEVRERMTKLDFEFLGLTRKVISGVPLWQDELWINSKG